MDIDDDELEEARLALERDIEQLQAESERLKELPPDERRKEAVVLRRRSQELRARNAQLYYRPPRVQ